MFSLQLNSKLKHPNSYSHSLIFLTLDPCFIYVRVMKSPVLGLRISARTSVFTSIWVHFTFPPHPKSIAKEFSFPKEIHVTCMLYAGSPVKSSQKLPERENPIGLNHAITTMLIKTWFRDISLVAIFFPDFNHVCCKERYKFVVVFWSLMNPLFPTLLLPLFWSPFRPPFPLPHFSV